MLKDSVCVLFVEAFAYSAVVEMCGLFDCLTKALKRAIVIECVKAYVLWQLVGDDTSNGCCGIDLYCWGYVLIGL